MYEELTDEEKQMIESQKTEGEAPSVSAAKSMLRICVFAAAFVAVVALGYYLVLLINYLFL